MDKLDKVIAALIFVVILPIYFTFLGAHKTEENYRTVCVEQGIAYWEVAADGSTTFKWVHEDGPQEVYSVSP